MKTEASATFSLLSLCVCLLPHLSSARGFGRRNRLSPFFLDDMFSSMSPWFHDPRASLWTHSPTPSPRAGSLLSMINQPFSFSSMAPSRGGLGLFNDGAFFPMFSRQDPWQQWMRSMVESPFVNHRHLMNQFFNEHYHPFLSSRSSAGNTFPHPHDNLLKYFPELELLLKPSTSTSQSTATRTATRTGTERALEGSHKNQHELASTSPHQPATVHDNDDLYSLGLIESEADYKMSIDIPAEMTMSDLDITVEKGMLKVTGKKEETIQGEGEGEGSGSMEGKRFVSISRSVRLPENSDKKKTSAKFTNGTLSITVPKKSITPLHQPELPSSPSASATSSSQQEHQAPAPQQDSKSKLTSSEENGEPSVKQSSSPQLENEHELESSQQVKIPLQVEAVTMNDKEETAEEKVEIKINGVDGNNSNRDNEL